MPKHANGSEPAVDMATTSAGTPTTTLTNSASTVSVGAPAAVSRRGFLKGIGSTGAAAGLGLGFSLTALESAEAAIIGPDTASQRRARAFQVRRNASRGHLTDQLPTQPTNNDEANYADRRSVFAKGLPHNSLGEPDPTAYQSLLDAIDSGDPADFEAIELSPIAVKKLANPQAAYAFEMVGTDSHSGRILAAPAFASAQEAAEMTEVYWQAITRDVPFAEYATNPLIAAAVADLNSLSHKASPTVGGQITTGTLFRGETPGDLVGPYISQFLWRNVPYGSSTIIQRYPTPIAGEDFMTDYNEWLAIQQGANQTGVLHLEAADRYIFDNRSLAEWVHRDVTFQGYFNAALILASFGGAALAASNPYKTSATQGGFITFGIADIAHLVTMTAATALKAAWWQKWLVHRALRPEAFAGRVENSVNGSKSYGIHPDVLNSDAVARLLSANGNALLPMAYVEGSPTHPSYPAGHATLSGSGATVLKAFFNEDFVIPNPVMADADGSELVPWTGAPLTIGNELNKLAANISIGRDAAGVHFRADGIQGLLLGEQIGISILRDYSHGYNEGFAGFNLTRFDGQEIVIVGGEVFEV
ncbi:MAG: vanadium-dependent haloperoxidase [Thermoanaerobaculia bacterium]|nr:vanadium-dependent haloperoxidase [Thermoanaerobaculia bacterium]